MFFPMGGGVVLNATFLKCSFCTDLFPNTLYRKCITFPPPPSPTPLDHVFKYGTHLLGLRSTTVFLEERQKTQCTIMVIEGYMRCLNFREHDKLIDSMHMR